MQGPTRLSALPCLCRPIRARSRDVLMQFERSMRMQSRPTILDIPGFQLVCLIVLGTLLPAIAMALILRWRVVTEPQFHVSAIGSLIAVLIGFFLIRKVTAYAGTGAFGMIIPSFGTGYGITIAILLGLRLNYSGIYLLISAFSILVGAFTLFLIRERSTRAHFYVVPYGMTDILYNIRDVDWITLENAEIPNQRKIAIVADLRYDHDNAWERMLAEAAILGHPVYHGKQIWESLTGRVSIEHMSENSFGSLIPNLAYRRIKRLTDIIAATLLLPLLIPLMSVIAAAIRIDSRGPVIFVQERMGYRGQIFRMFKFRTMRPRQSIEDEAGQRSDAMTQNDDVRITRVGRFLRRIRFDELPQLINVLRGEMSFIGPRPEAVALSQWYEAEIPFYRYRHIVRPGITGWAQVRQGHVTSLDDIDQKLNFDFYYIKNFSLWLDMLIALRTVPTMLLGFGSK